MDLLVIQDFAERCLQIKTQLTNLLKLKEINQSILNQQIDPIKIELVSLFTELASIESIHQLSKNDNVEITDRLINYSITINNLQSLFKQTIQTIKSNQQQSTRNTLLGGMQQSTSSGGNKRFEIENELEASKKVRQSLNNLLQMVTLQVQRSKLSTNKLFDSSRILKLTMGEFRGFASLLKESKQILGNLMKGDKKDLVLILLAFFVFVLAVLYVVKTRILRLVTFGYL